MAAERTSKAVGIGALPVRLSEGRSEIEFSINEPGIVRAVAFCLEKRLVMSTRGEPQFDEVLTLFVEFSPTGPKRNRRFVVMATGQVLGVPDGHALAFVGSAISVHTAQVAHVFEVREVS